MDLVNSPKHCVYNSRLMGHIPISRACLCCSLMSSSSSKLMTSIRFAGVLETCRQHKTLLQFHVSIEVVLLYATAVVFLIKTKNVSLFSRYALFTHMFWHSGSFHNPVLIDVYTTSGLNCLLYHSTQLYCLLCTPSVVQREATR
jgi:hypothetical protein